MQTTKLDSDRVTTGTEWVPKAQLFLVSALHARWLLTANICSLNNAFLSEGNKCLHRSDKIKCP